MKTDLNQCAQCGNHIHKEHEIECKENGEVLCISCSWLRTNDSDNEAMPEVREHKPGTN
jgi:predicted sulfurtransferase